MSDNLTTPVQSGVTLASDDVGGVQYPRSKVSFGVDGAAVDASATNPLPVLDSSSLAKIEAVRALLAGLLAVDTVVKATATSRSGSYGTASTALMPANASRRGYLIQNQSDTATIYVNGLGAAAADSSSLKIGPGGAIESAVHHVGVSAVYILSTEANTPVYAREW